jgi:hypothetical protein
MDNVGISFRAPLSPDEVKRGYIEPLRDALEQAHAGIYSNYLRRLDDEGPAEHLLVFQLRDFTSGLRLLRVALDKLGRPADLALHNLNASPPMY